MSASSRRKRPKTSPKFERLAMRAKRKMSPYMEKINSPEGQFPKRIRIGENRVAWLKDEIDSWIEDRVNARLQQ